MYGYNSLSAILNVQNSKLIILINLVFKPFENQNHSILIYKILYVFINFFVFGFVIYRINNMGLLPLSPADWISVLENDIPSKKVIYG